MSSLAKKHPRLALVLLNLGVLIALSAAVEIVLRVFFPYRIATVGNIESPNAALYGWGYNPHELVTITDPDTGAIYRAPTNSRGWRDRDRQFENPGRKFRILVLGDSVTFGGVVPADKLYTRLLEDLLQAQGYGAEVISIGYGGWGTDHQLEVLRREGLLYQPDLVIFQWGRNDLTDNLSRGGSELGSVKPFYYELDAAGSLVRMTPPPVEGRLSAKDRVKLLVSKSEILKRLFGAYQRMRGLKGRGVPYEVTEQKLLQLRLVLGDPSLPDSLRGDLGRRLKREKLVTAISAHGLQAQQELILRVLEKRWFDRYWSQKEYRPQPPDPQSVEWRLYFSLMREAGRLAATKGAGVAIFSDVDDGLYRWSVYWGRISPDQEYRQNFLACNTILKEFAAENGIGYIDQKFEHLRARNDPHSNAAGNYAMAMNIYQFLMENFKAELEASKSVPTGMSSRH